MENTARFLEEFTERELLRDTTFLITGATGLIGSSLIKCLCALDRSIRILAPVRNLEKGRRLFGDSPQVKLIAGDLRTLDYPAMGSVDYIVHGAAPTSSRYFVEHPVETINTIVADTDRILAYARTIPLKGMVYLSSLEVYGAMHEPVKVTEEMQGYVSLCDLRSSYPMGKRMAENLCCAYAAEYGVPVRSARLTQTTGAGVEKSDNRFIAQFVRCAVEGRDIVLRTEGLSSRPCCHIVDAVTAILQILLHGEDGKAYNVANEETYITVRDMAHRVRELLNPDINVRVEIDANMGYPPDTHLDLSTSALQSIGWRPRHGLDDILRQLYEYLKEA